MICCSLVVCHVCVIMYCDDVGLINDCDPFFDLHFEFKVVQFGR